MIFNIHILELAIISALLSLFLDFCFRDGNIFEGWLDFLADLHLPENVVEADIDREDRFKLVKWFWFKPLGGCVVCMNVWISFVICACFFKKVQVDLGLLNIVEFLLGALLIFFVDALYCPIAPPAVRSPVLNILRVYCPLTVLNVTVLIPSAFCSTAWIIF